MKILICVTYLSGGGAERVATLWAKGFVNEGYEVALCLNTDNTTVSYPVPDVVTIFNVYKKENRFLRGVGVGVAFRLRKILKSYKPDVIIGVLPSWCLIIWMAKIGLNIPFVDTEHNAFERPKEAPMRWREKTDKFIFSKLADGMTVLTRSDYNIIGVKRNNTFVMPNPLAFETLKEVTKKETIILACGRLDAWYTKGFDLLIEAWGKIANKYKDWMLVIAGDGLEPNKNFLQELSEKNGLTMKNFHMIGRCDDIKKIYQNSSIFVLSSRFEGFGMVLTEAMSQGCACIACDYKGRQADIIKNGDEGLVISTGNSDIIAKSITGLIEDDSLRIKYQMAAMRRSYDYTLEKVMDKWNEVFNAIIRGGV